MQKLKSKKMLWFINFVMFTLVVFLGIQQGGKGAEIAKMEDELKNLQLSRQNYLENILLVASNDQIEKKAVELGFNKPSSMVYIDSIDVLTSNLVR